MLRYQSAKPTRGRSALVASPRVLRVGCLRYCEKNNTERGKSYDRNDEESDAVPDVDIAHVLLRFGNGSSRAARYARDRGITSVGFGLSNAKQRKKGSNNISQRCRSRARARVDLLLRLS